MNPPVRLWLIVFDAFLGLSAIAGGVGLLAGLNTPPLALLAGSPFPSFVIPGLALLVLVGGTASSAALLLISRHPQARTLCIAAASAILIFEIVEVAAIGSPEGIARNLQALYFTLGIVIGALALISRRRDTSSPSVRAGTLGLWLLCASIVCQHAGRAEGDSAHDRRTRIIVDSDANNELDDQHAIAYVLLNHGTFDVEGITVNRTSGGGSIREHAEEAERVVRLCGVSPAVRVYEGATGSFEEIRSSVRQPGFDGSAAVDFIVQRANAASTRKLVLLAIGKLTNIGLALCKDPSIGPKIRVVWLGSNYPEPGEYNLENDTSVVNYVLSRGIDFEFAVVRYGKPGGTAAVQVSVDEIRANMKGKGPRISRKVTGRHGGEFDCFGDYSISLFEHVTESSRSLYDLAAAAIVKEPRWARKTTIHAPRFENGMWREQPDNPRRLILWEDFDKENILRDLYRTMNQR